MSNKVELKEAVQFVKHGVLNRQFDEQLTHITFTTNSIQSYNGVVIINYPVQGVGEFSVSSTKIIRAIQACDFAPVLSLTEKSVVVKGKRFKTVLPYDTARLPHQKITGKEYTLPENLLTKLKLLTPMISDDASRSWSQTMMVKKGYVYVTNNVICVRAKLDLPNCTLPAELTSVLLKIKQQPTSLVFGDGAMLINYENGAWIQCKLCVSNWPKGLNKRFDEQCNPPKIPKGLKDKIDTAAPFCEDDMLVFKGNKLYTDTTVLSKVGVPDCTLSCVNMQKVLTVFDRVDFSKPVMDLKGDGIVGIMAQAVHHG